jgi:hypothetical protein
MTKRKVSRATLNEVLAFTKSRGVVLSDEAIRLLKDHLEAEPISKPTLERSKKIVRNPLLKQILDHTFIKRSERIQKLVETNPLMQLIDEKRRQLFRKKEVIFEKQMPDNLRKIFYDESRWQPYVPFVYIRPEGQIIKVIELVFPDKPYIGYLCVENDVTMIYTTRRHIPLDSLPKAKFYKLKEGVFHYEIEENKKIDKEYGEYIMLFHQ